MIVDHIHAVFEVLVGTFRFKRPFKAVKNGEKLLHTLNGSVLVCLRFLLCSPFAVVIVLRKQPQVLILFLCEGVFEVSELGS